MPDLTLRDLIQAAGGTNAYAERCGRTPGAVSKWIRDGRLPASDLDGRTNHAGVLVEMLGGGLDVWAVRLIGRR